MKKIKVKIHLLSLRIRNIFLRIKMIGKFKYNINILSTKKYKYKVKEDINLEYYLLKNRVKCKIVPYEKNINTNVIIRTIWGYHNNINKFIYYIKNNNNIIINSKDVILNNYDKKSQYDILMKYNINVVHTNFVDKLEDLIGININNKVIKPRISASGNNTFLIRNDVDKIKAINEFKNHNIKDIMIQPFIKSVSD